MNSAIARERISAVIKPDTITASQGDFLATHVAVKKLHLLRKFDFSPSNLPDVTEEKIYTDIILNPENKHQFVTVYGQSGTGKSHLIRWFEARFEQDKPDNEIVLFIKRSDNTLKGTIKQLLTIPEVQGIKNKDIYERLVKASVSVDEDVLKDLLYHNFIIEIDHDSDDHPISIDSITRKRLSAFLKNEIVQQKMLDPKGPIERIYSKIAEHSAVDRDTVAQFTAQDFIVSADLYDEMLDAGSEDKALKLARKLQSDIAADEKSKEISDYLNQFVNDVIQRCAGIEPGDFRQIFIEIRKELYRLGKNLTLFIEDVTSFTGVDDAILDALIVEHTGKNAEEKICRISSIVGTTNYYLENKFNDNHKDRITQYIYIPENVFSDDDLFEFIGRYLNTMSLPEKAVNDWLAAHANANEYPMHEITDGKNWDYYTTAAGIIFSLYPFTKSSIKYFYAYNIKDSGHKTPRYIIRDIIEPVVSDILADKMSFPSEKYTVSTIDVTLNKLIHDQVKGDTKAEARLIRLLSIWGNQKPEQYTDENGITYIASLNKAIFEELGLPSISFNVIEEPKSAPQQGNGDNPQSPTTPQPDSTEDKIPPEVKGRVAKISNILSGWTNGDSIDTSSNVGLVGILNAVQTDMHNYVVSSIDWQIEGISADNILKIKNSKSVKPLIAFANQIKGSGFYTLSADWNSMSIIMAFVRWREYGKQSWNYPDADYDVLLVTSWIAQIKTDIVNAVREPKDGLSYIEAAMVAEIYKKIICGQYKERSLNNFTIQNLVQYNEIKQENTGHSKEWLSLISVLQQKGNDKANLGTVTRYYNIIQGEVSGSVIVLDRINLTKALHVVKTKKLFCDIPSSWKDDPIKTRRDSFEFLQGIKERIDTVAQAELKKAKQLLDEIAEEIDIDELDEDDIIDLVQNSKTFYDSCNEALINIASVSFDSIEKKAKQIEKAIKDILSVSEKSSTLSILMAFSSDPIKTILPLVSMIEQLKKDTKKASDDLQKQKTTLGITGKSGYIDTDYATEKKIISDCLTFFEGGC